RTDLHLAEGDLQPRRPRTVPGHEVVGVVAAVGPGAERFAPGERIGMAWLRGTCGRCRWCRTGRENLCPSAVFTGWDADGGYAEYAVVPEAYAYRLPDALDDVTAAPLLCAGIVGYRALVRAEVPPGGRLGIYGFGASAHVVAQVAIAQGATVHVVTRSPAAPGRRRPPRAAPGAGARAARRRAGRAPAPRGARPPGGPSPAGRRASPPWRPTPVGTGKASPPGQRRRRTRTSRTRPSSTARVP